VSLVEESQVGFVRQSGRLKRVAGALPLEISGRQAAHLRVDQGKKRLKSARISLSPTKKGLSDL
jgi:hypothetical protein